MAEINVVDLVRECREKISEYRNLGIEYVVSHSAIKAAHDTIQESIDVIRDYPNADDDSNTDKGLNILSQLVYSDTVKFRFKFDVFDQLFYKGLPIFPKDEIEYIYNLQKPLHKQEDEKAAEIEILADDESSLNGAASGIKYRITSIKLWYSKWSKSYALSVEFVVVDTFDVEPAKEPAGNLSDDDSIDLNRFV